MQYGATYKHLVSLLFLVSEEGICLGLLKLFLHKYYREHTTSEILSNMGQYMFCSYCMREQEPISAAGAYGLLV